MFMAHEFLQKSLKKRTAALLGMKRVLLALDNTCDRRRLAATVTALRLPALGTHTCAHCTHTHSPWHPRERDPLLFLGISSSSARDKEPPGERAGASECALLSQAMALAWVASVVVLPSRGGATQDALLLQLL